MPRDAKEYLHLLDEMDLTVPEKIDLIQVVISYTDARLDKLFGVHPVQMARENAALSNTRSAANDIGSKGTSTVPNFKRASAF